MSMSRNARSWIVGIIFLLVIIGFPALMYALSLPDINRCHDAGGEWLRAHCVQTIRIDP
jgi:hypothetical protein